MDEGGWSEILRRLHRLPEQDACFVIMNPDTLPVIRRHRLVGVQLVGHWLADGAEEIALFAALNRTAVNRDKTVMDGADLLDLAVAHAAGAVTLYGDVKGLYAHHPSWGRESKWLSAEFTPEALGRGYGQCRHQAFQPDYEAEFSWDGIIVPGSWIGGTVLTAIGAWD